MNLIAVLLSGFLAVAPGAWIAFTLGAANAFSVRFALAAALSPFVVGVQMLALTALGVPFAAAAAAAVILNAPAAWLMWRKRPQPLFSREWLAPWLCIGVLAGGLIALWLVSPALRIYSWHNMMQAEAVYQVARLPHWPEEMGLAGLSLNYAWFGHIQIAAAGRLADASPFLVFPVLNVVTLAAFFLLMLACVRRFTDGGLAIVSLLTAAALLSPNFVGVIAQYLQAPGGAGDIRLSTPLHKFLHFDLMTSGFALFAGTMLLALEERTLARRILMLVCMSAIAVVYPLLLPAALAVTGALLAAPVATELWNGKGWRLPRGALLDLALLAPPVLIGALYLKLLGGDAASISATLAPWWDMRHRVIDGALRTAGLWLPFLIGAAWRVWRTREPKRLALFAAAAALSAVYMAVNLPVHVEYKFMTAALLCLLPLVVEQALDWAGKLGRYRVAAVIGASALVFAVVAPHIVLRHAPWRLLETAPPLSEPGFAVTSAAHAWMDAVRDDTPADTVTIRPPMVAPAEVLTQRATYAALNLYGAPRSGYTMSARETLESVKGYPSALIDHRLEVLRALYTGDVDAVAIDAELAALGRPVAIYLPRDNAYLRALEAAQRGRVVYADDAAVVRLIEPAAGHEVANAR